MKRIITARFVERDQQRMEGVMTAILVRLEDFFLRILILAIFGVWYE